jgi:hypothetical protein
MDNLSFDVSILKPFDPLAHSPAKLQEVARADTSEEVIEYLVSYTGNPVKKSSLELRILWKDSEPDKDTYYGHHQMYKTTAMDSFIERHPELRVLNKK